MAGPERQISPQMPKPDAFAAASTRLDATHTIGSARLRKIAALLKGEGRESAEAELRKYLDGHPEDADALALMAETALSKGRLHEAAALFERCLERAPGFAAARYRYANLLFRLNRFAAALREMDILLAHDSGNPLFRQMKANLLRIIGDDAQSLVLFEQLAEEHPSRAECWIAYGHALRVMGYQDKSVAAYRNAIDRRPSSGLAWWSLANMKTLRFGAPDTAAMETQLRWPDISPDDRIALQFALGKAHEDLGAYDKAFDHYAKANAGLRLRLPYNAGKIASRAADSRRLFTAGFFESHKAVGCTAPDPIFIVGQPRSGSTLIEQILSSHSAIEGTAELPYIPAIVAEMEEREGADDYLDVLARLEPGAFAAMGEDYLDRARVHRKTHRPFFIDKRPANFWHIGLIQLMLPNAKIIDARRNPAACLLSMFKLYFNRARPHLTELGRSYRDYVSLMAHFDTVLPGKIHRVIFEDLIGDPEAETRRLLDYLGLPFEESCLRFYEASRTVRTSSSEQVRRPITGEAVDQWRNFEPWLGPLLRSAGSAFSEYPSVPEELR
ncbi:MAG TPA: sulfotransferase [Rhizomicrobium sp.]|nr:sulfotransferase [Rhizomicrobium sp.]